MKSITLTLCALMIVIGSIFYYKMTTGKSNLLESSKLRDSMVNNVLNSDVNVSPEGENVSAEAEVAPVKEVNSDI